MTAGFRIPIISTSNSVGRQARVPLSIVSAGKSGGFLPVIRVLLPAGVLVGGELTIKVVPDEQKINCYRTPVDKAVMSGLLRNE